MSQFFINRPIFAWVIATLIILSGVISIPKLAIERFPSVAPPSVSLYLTYPGASPQTLNDSVVSLIEREISGVKGLMYFKSSSDSTGNAEITVTFENGINPELAQVEIQNKLKAIEARLPLSVRQSGVQVESSSSSTLMYVGLISPNGEYTESELSDYMARNIIEELKRIHGVGRIQMFGSEFAMRIWIDPIKLNAFNLTVSDVTKAIQEQNVQISPGKVGDAPINQGQKTVVPLMAQGQLETPEEFRDIVLRSTSNGGSVLLSDVAEVELGSQNYQYSNRYDGQASTSASVKLSPGANAISASNGIRSRLDELKQAMPAGIDYTITSDAAPFAKISITKVIVTLAEAMVLVFLVMYLFLQNVRYTIIPAIVAPIALLGTFTVMLMFGFSINVFSMFGMVLAIGIIVDDAIVVVENVERVISETGVSAKKATQMAMKDIYSALVGITAVLSAVFIPMAFAAGSVGIIFQQFALAMSVSILFSAFLALTLTPALCATILKPHSEAHDHKRGFFNWFNRGFERLSKGYQSWVAKLVVRTGRMMVIYLAFVAVAVFSFNQIPSTFLPEEDQGYFFTSIQLPSDATAERTMGVVKKVENFVQSRDAVESSMSILGFSFSGSGAGSAFTVTTLRDWNERNNATTQQEVQALTDHLQDLNEGVVFGMLPTAIDGLGTSSNISLQLLDRSNSGYQKFQNTQRQFIQKARESRLFSSVFFESLPEANSIKLKIDRKKAQVLGVSFTSISDTISTALGSNYVNDFPNKGRLQQVIIQANAESRMRLEDILKLSIRNERGGMVYLSEFIEPVWKAAPLQLTRFNGIPSVAISVAPAAGVSSGQAMIEIEKIVASLPAGISIEWTGISRQEKQTESQTTMLLAFSMLVIFLVLSALYESWTTPLAVILVVPLGIIGSIAAVLVANMSNDVFFKVGLVTIIGLSAKNAILIIEFAQIQRAQGKGLLEATIDAARMRLRPILMTSLAFTCGIIPLVLATGASSEIQNSIGTGVLGGMISGTVLAIFFVPVFFVFINELIEKYKRKGKHSTELN